MSAPVLRINPAGKWGGIHSRSPPREVSGLSLHSLKFAQVSPTFHRTDPEQKPFGETGSACMCNFEKRLKLRRLKLPCDLQERRRGVRQDLSPVAFIDQRSGLYIHLAVLAPTAPIGRCRSD